MLGAAWAGPQLPGQEQPPGVPSSGSSSSVLRCYNTQQVHELQAQQATLAGEVGWGTWTTK